MSCYKNRVGFRHRETLSRRFAGRKFLFRRTCRRCATGHFLTASAHSSACTTEHERSPRARYPSGQSCSHSAVMRALLFILDLPGLGTIPDALPLRALDSLGLWKSVSADMFHPRSQGVRGCWGRTKSRSTGQDATSVFWEIAGVILDEPLPAFARFPEDLV